MIIIDYSQISLASVFMMEKEFSSDLEKNRGIIKHTVISSILANKKKFEGDYGSDIVLACDGGDYWRKSEFAYYKSGRKKKREASNLDWKFVFDVLNETRDELKAHFPYKVIRLDRTEADDIIACLCKWTQDNYLTENGIEPIPKKTLIISSDKDFKQLHRYANIRQYSPLFKKYVEKPKNVQEFINEHIAQGDSGDGIPNILSLDSSFADNIRQKPMYKARLEEFVKLGIEACKTDEEKRNWQRNELLISFEKIPQEINDNIINAFADKPLGNKNSIFGYLVKNKMRLLLNEIDNF